MPSQRSAPMRGARACTLTLGALLLSAVPACGGTIKFSDAKPIAVRGPAPPAPVEPAKPKRVEVTVDHIEITEKIQFDLDKATIKSESHSLLNEIAQVLRDNAQIRKVEIIGHTDGDGAEKYNQDLSERRAKAVLEYLTGPGGIASGRLTSKGMGKSAPIADNNTMAGKEKNRRVEFLIVEQDSAKGGAR
jgi:outer membrane protein OmpA-like peptidoglycan-associated protein